MFMDVVKFNKNRSNYMKGKVYAKSVSSKDPSIVTTKSDKPKDFLEGFNYQLKSVGTKVKDSTKLSVLKNISDNREILKSLIRAYRKSGSIKVYDSIMFRVFNSPKVQDEEVTIFKDKNGKARLGTAYSTKTELESAKKELDNDSDKEVSYQDDDKVIISKKNK